MSLASAAGLGVGSGVNAYASLLVLGLVGRFMPGTFTSEASQMLSSTPALIVLGILYAIEFAADKIPAIDHMWDLVHTFIRPVAGGFAAFAASSPESSPALLIAATALGGGAALTSHVGKATLRGVSTTTTGGLMNPVLSVVEDVVAITGVIVAIFLPLLVLLFLAFVVVLFAWALSRYRGRRPSIA